MKIFINAGHGGKDCGAVSKNGFFEKDITKTIAAFLANMLIEKGYDIEYFQQKNWRFYYEI
jgi:N-acetylmuramoyl-L-alanine amidase